MPLSQTFLLEQPERGYRFNVASLVLVAHVAELGPAGRVLEVGSGVGLISLLLSSSGAFGSLEGVEIQPIMHAFSLKNVEYNRGLLRAPVAFHQGDARAWRERWDTGSFQRVIANPPFFKLNQGHPSPDPVNRIARQEVMLTSAALLEAASGLLAPDGVGAFLYPVQRGFEVAAEAEALGLHVRRRAVRSFVDDPPFLAIVDVAHRPFEPPPERVRPLTMFDAPHVYQAWLQPWVDLIRKPVASKD